jgi:hypothetical protein
MNDDWIEEAERLFEDLARGDEARRFLFSQLVVGITPSSDEDAFDKLAKRCVKETHRRIDAGALSKPADWVMVMSGVLTMAEALDRARVLQDGSQLARLRKLVQTV